MIQFLAPICISSGVLWLIFFTREPTLSDYGGTAAYDFFVAVAASVLFCLPIYVVADLLRRAWQVPPWGIPLFAAGICLFLAYLVCYGLSHDPTFHSPSGVLHFGGGIFLLSLCFGIPYTLALYVRRPRND